MYVKQNMPCLEHCLKKLSKGLESIMVSAMHAVGNITATDVHMYTVLVHVNLNALHVSQCIPWATCLYLYLYN